MNEDEQNNKKRTTGIPSNFGMSFEDFVQSIPSNQRESIQFNFPTAYKYVGQNGETNVITPEVVITPDNNKPKLTYQEYMQNKKLKESLKNRDTAGKIGTVAMAAGLAPVMLGTTSYVLPQIVRGLTTFGRFMTPSSHQAIFGTGPYKTALGGTNASTAGAIADNALFSLGATSALKTFQDDPSLGTGISLLASSVTGSPTMNSMQVKVYKTLRELQALKAKNQMKQFNKLVETTKAELVNGNFLDGKNAESLLKHPDEFFNSSWGTKNRTYQAIFSKIKENAKGARGANQNIKEAIKLDSANDIPVQLQKIRDFRVKELGNKSYSELVEEANQAIKNKYGIGIDWSDQAPTVMSAMPDDLKIAKVGFKQGESDNSFLKRYYDNVLKVIAPDGIQAKLLNNGELRVNPKTKQWEGLFEDGKYYKVEPTDYIKTKIAQQNGIELGLPKNMKAGADYYLYHGTRDETISHLINPNDIAGENSNGNGGIWTVMRTSKPSSANAIEYFKGSGYSVPFFRLPKYESDDVNHFLKNVGSSNSIWGTGESMLQRVQTNPGRVIRATGVQDGTFGGNLIEYIFGKNTKNPKSMWNTLDFEPGAGPMAYNNQNTNNNTNFA